MARRHETLCHGVAPHRQRNHPALYEFLYRSNASQALTCHYTARPTISSIASSLGLSSPQLKRRERFASGTTMPYPRTLTPFHHQSHEDIGKNAKTQSQDSAAQKDKPVDPPATAPRDVRSPIGSSIYKERADGVMRIEVSRSVFEEAANTGKMLGPRPHHIGDKEYLVLVLVLHAEDRTAVAKAQRAETGQDRDRQRGRQKNNRPWGCADSDLLDEDVEARLHREAEDDGFGSDANLFGDK